MTLSMKMAELERVSEEKGIAKNAINNVSNLMKNFSLTIEQALDALGISENDWRAYLELNEENDE